MAVEQRLFDIPQLLGQVHVVVVGILEPLYLVPQGIHLPLAVGPAGLQVGDSVDQRAALENGHHQFPGLNLGVDLPLPGGVRVEELQGLVKVERLVVEANEVGLRLAGVLGENAVDFFKVGGGNLGGVLAEDRKSVV